MAIVAAWSEPPLEPLPQPASRHAAAASTVRRRVTRAPYPRMGVGNRRNRVSEPRGAPARAAALTSRRAGGLPVPGSQAASPLCRESEVAEEARAGPLLEPLHARR